MLKPHEKWIYSGTTKYFDKDKSTVSFFKQFADIYGTP
jgi:hypothetical protein